MRLNVPLLPVQIDVQWRTLPPFRFSIRGLMLAVVVLGILFSLMAQTARLAALDRHFWEQLIASPANHAGNEAMYTKYHAALIESDTKTGRLCLTVLSLLGLGVIGRILNRVRSGREAVALQNDPGRRSVASP